MSWKHQANCRGLDPSIFVEDTEGRFGIKQLKRAKFICSDCPVSAQCIEYARVNRIYDGIYGGMTHAERLNYAAERRGLVIDGPNLAPHGTVARYMVERRQARAGLPVESCPLCRKAFNARMMANRKKRKEANATRIA